MEGVQLVVNDKGETTSVIVDLHVWGELWEDLYDVIVAHVRAGEETIPWEQVKTGIRAKADDA